MNQIDMFNGTTPIRIPRFDARDAGNSWSKGIGHFDDACDMAPWYEPPVFSCYLFGRIVHEKTAFRYEDFLIPGANYMNPHEDIIFTQDGKYWETEMKKLCPSWKK